MARGNEVISLTSDDRKRKSFKTAPAGKYFIRIHKDSKLKQMSGGTGAELKLVITKGPHKGVTCFDSIAAHVTWKLGQLLEALGIKKNKFTMAEFLKLVKNKELRAMLRIDRWEGQKRNKVAQYLPLTAAADEADDDIEDEDDELEESDESEDDEEDDDESEDDDSDDEDDESDNDDDDEDDEEDDDDEDDDDESDDDDDDDSDDDDDDDAEEEEEEAPAPVSRRRAPAKKAAAKKAPAKRAAAKKAPAKRGRK